MKKQGILNRELAAAFAKLGHTDQITIADCGLPIPDGVRCIDLSYIIGKPSFMEILEAVLDDFEVEYAFIANEMALGALEAVEAVDASIPVELELIKK